LKTPNVHSEVVTNLSASANVSSSYQNAERNQVRSLLSDQIAEAYRRYGITKDTKDLFVVKITKNGEPTSESIASHLSANVEGEQLAATDENITPITDLSKVYKYYKLNGLNWLDKIDNPAARHRELEMLVLGSMALKGI
jgi:EKC/KEOPS complex subunit CGI121/TPRKB